MKKFARNSPHSYKTIKFLKIQIMNSKSLLLYILCIVLYDHM